MLLEEYLDIRFRTRMAGFNAEYHWAETVGVPASALHFAREHAWIVCNSGMKNQIAEKIFQRIMGAMDENRDIAEVFGHQKKVEAIKYVFKHRERLLSEFLACGTDEEKLAFCEGLPHVGEITKYHLAKNYGVDCAKPDRHLVRISALSEETPHELCQRLSEASGDRIATVDVVLWRAANLGFL